MEFRSKGGAVIANPVDDIYSLNFDDIEKLLIKLC